MARDPKCKDCYYSRDTNEADKLECRINPPIAQPTPYLGHSCTLWPNVNICDWCGKFEDREYCLARDDHMEEEE
jgi:hypothetical protein